MYIFPAGFCFPNPLKPDAMRKNIIIILASFLFWNPSNAQTKTAKRNVLFIIFDDLNDWVLNPADHPKPFTPNIDRLRKRSVTFTNAHTVVPVCGPSRKCLFSGLYPQTTGSYDFAAWNKVKTLSDRTPLPLHFRNNGYHVYGTGKLLHEGKGGDFYTEYGIGPDYGPWPWKGVGKPFFTAHPNRYKAWIPFIKEPVHRDLNFGSLADVPRWEPDSAEGIPGAYGWFGDEGKPFRYVNESDRDQLPDEVSADWAVEVLGRKHESPFYLGVGFVRPHTPLYVPKEYYDLYPVENVRLPPYRKDDLDDVAPVLRNRWKWGFDKYDALIKSGGEKEWKEWIRGYLASITFADAQLGKVLDALENSGQLDNTIIVLTSDNGYHAGEKNVVQKWHLWNESTKVPLLISIPGNPGNGSLASHPVSLIDVYPTLTDLCGLGQPSGQRLDGQSLHGLLNAPHKKWGPGRPVALMAIKDEADFNEQAQPPSFSVVSDRYRYTLCFNGEQELYDHKVDPNEWTNLAGNPKFNNVAGNLKRELLKVLRETSVPNAYQQYLNSDKF
jgi:arylsulfatase A-like enzyme